MLAVNWSLGAAPEVNLRNLQWTGNEANRGSTLALKSIAHITISLKHEYQWFHKRTYGQQQFKKKRRHCIFGGK